MVSRLNFFLAGEATVNLYGCWGFMDVSKSGYTDRSTKLSLSYFLFHTPFQLAPRRSWRTGKDSGCLENL